ncbi:hypothetical protein BDQ12DRAFT_108563 [Crucibulum laeve]|uniref:Uncharacterized protein n=1 Tax=Crucibulum laeve TaxID=68775 RepID=A0A5C3MAZ2_9AGAR|nr:hypothetical protein BDQ12DRAFT_108563 [Crucibulum laeve]
MPSTISPLLERIIHSFALFWIFLRGLLPNKKLFSPLSSAAQPPPPDINTDVELGQVVLQDSPHPSMDTTDSVRHNGNTAIETGQFRHEFLYNGFPSLPSRRSLNDYDSMRAGRRYSSYGSVKCSLDLVTEKGYQVLGQPRTLPATPKHDSRSTYCPRPTSSFDTIDRPAGLGVSLTRIPGCQDTTISSSDSNSTPLRESSKFANVSHDPDADIDVPWLARDGSLYLLPIRYPSGEVTQSQQFSDTGAVEDCQDTVSHSVTTKPRVSRPSIVELPHSLQELQKIEHGTIIRTFSAPLRPETPHLSGRRRSSSPAPVWYTDKSLSVHEDSSAMGSSLPLPQPLSQDEACEIPSLEESHHQYLIQTARSNVLSNLTGLPISLYPAPKPRHQSRVSFDSKMIISQDNETYPHPSPTPASFHSQYTRRPSSPPVWFNDKSLSSTRSSRAVSLPTHMSAISFNMHDDWDPEAEWEHEVSLGLEAFRAGKREAEDDNNLFFRASMASVQMPGEHEFEDVFGPGRHGEAVQVVDNDGSVDIADGLRNYEQQADLSDEEVAGTSSGSSTAEEPREVDLVDFTRDDHPVADEDEYTDVPPVPSTLPNQAASSERIESCQESTGREEDDQEEPAHPPDNHTRSASSPIALPPSVTTCDEDDSERYLIVADIPTRPRSAPIPTSPLQNLSPITFCYPHPDCSFDDDDSDTESEHIGVDPFAQVSSADIQKTSNLTEVEREKKLEEGEVTSDLASIFYTL